MRVRAVAGGITAALALLLVTPVAVEALAPPADGDYVGSNDPPPEAPGATYHAELSVEGNQIVFASVHWGGRYCEDTNMDVDPWVHWGSDNPTDPVDPSQSVSIVNGSFTVHEEDGYGGPTDPNGGYHYEQTLTGTFDGGQVTGTIRRTDTQYAYDSYAGAVSDECDSGPVPWSASNSEAALIACSSAQSALEKARAKLARLRQHHASKAAIKKAKKRVKAAKHDVEVAC